MYDNEERCAMGLSVFQMSLVQADKHRIGFSAQAVNPVWSEGGREAGGAEHWYVLFKPCRARGRHFT